MKFMHYVIETIIDIVILFVIIVLVYIYSNWRGLEFGEILAIFALTMCVIQTRDIRKLERKS